jgi:hypothetical protein
LAQEKQKLERIDYLALFIAALETIAIPLLVFIAIIVVLVVIFR